MDTTQLIADLQMLCGCMYDITDKSQIKDISDRLEDIIIKHFKEEFEIKRISNGKKERG